MIRPRNSTLFAALAAVLAAPLVFAGCGTHVDGGGGTITGCKVDGKVFAPGATFPASDGCNTCTCEDDGSSACTLLACNDGCVDYQGVDRSLGESWPAGDGCNTCSCDSPGLVGCTLVACFPCSYGGQTYESGESFPALDGCNTCTCDEFGGVGCTKIACVCDPENEWWREYVATDPEQCKAIDYACPPNTTMFGNSCGCGCEQDASCPEWFDCMPPKPCDPQMLMAECPYSGIAY